MLHKCSQNCVEQYIFYKNIYDSHLVVYSVLRKEIFHVKIVGKRFHPNNGISTINLLSSGNFIMAFAGGPLATVTARTVQL